MGNFEFDIIISVWLCSDHIALLKAFESWQEAKRAGRERNFCWENYLSSNTLQMMDDMRRQFQDLLSDIGFFDKSKGPQVRRIILYIYNLYVPHLGCLQNALLQCVGCGTYHDYSTLMMILGV